MSTMTSDYIINTTGLDHQATLTNSALNDLATNKDPTKIATLSALVMAQSASLDSLKKATENALQALLGKS